MSLAEPLITNREGSIVIEELAAMSGISAEQFLADCVLTLFICVNTIKENIRNGKPEPTLLVIEQEDGSYDSVDLLKAVSEPRDELRPSSSSCPTDMDPFENDQIIILSLSAEARQDLEQVCGFLAVSQHTALTEAINLRGCVQQAAAKSLTVLLEQDVPGEYFVVPTEF